MNGPKTAAVELLARYEMRGIFRQLGARLSVDPSMPARGGEVQCVLELTTYDTCVYVGEVDVFRRKFWIDTKRPHTIDAAVWEAASRAIHHECLEGLYRDGKCVPKDPHA